MVLQSIEIFNDDHIFWGDQRWMREFVGTESIWTIDLVTLLHHAVTNVPLGESLPEKCPVHYLFCSTKFGVDESYKLLDYYQAAFQHDLQRVERLFASAFAQNIPLLRVTHLSLKLLIHIISIEGCIAIVLIDNRVLLARDSKSNDGDDISCATYSGHYVILCGISYDTNEVNYAKSLDDDSLDGSIDDEQFCIVLKNPGSWKEQEFVTAKRFEAAWRASGTDEDIIFINLH
jgi:hypothetical protein